MAGPYTPGNLELLNQKFNAEIKNIVMKKTVLRPMVTVDTSNVGIETFYSESTTELAGQNDIPRESEFYADQVILDTIAARPVKYGIESRISWEDQLVAAMNLPTRTTLRIANYLLRKEDSLIWNTLSQNQTATTINSVAAGNTWNNATRANRLPHEDIGKAIALVAGTQMQAYQPDTLLVNPTQYAYLRTNDYIMSSFDSAGPELMDKGVMGNLLGLTVVAHPVVTTAYAGVCNAKEAVTIKDVGGGINTNIVDNPGKYKVFSGWFYEGMALTDPKAMCLITTCGV